jgi:hypothetical protein
LYNDFLLNLISAYLLSLAAPHSDSKFLSAYLMSKKESMLKLFILTLSNSLLQQPVLGIVPEIKVLMYIHRIIVANF